MPPPTLNEKLRDQLRQAILDITQAEADIVTGEAAVLTARTAMDVASRAKIKAVGSRDGLAILFLPPGLTLDQAWAQDFKGLRTGT